MAEYADFSKEIRLPQQMQRVYANGIKNIGVHGKLKIKPKTFIHTKKSNTIKAYEKGGSS